MKDSNLNKCDKVVDEQHQKYKKAFHQIYQPELTSTRTTAAVNSDNKTKPTSILTQILHANNGYSEILEKFFISENKTAFFDNKFKYLDLIDLRNFSEDEYTRFFELSIIIKEFFQYAKEEIHKRDRYPNSSPKNSENQGNSHRDKLVLTSNYPYKIRDQTDIAEPKHYATGPSKSPVLTYYLPGIECTKTQKGFSVIKNLADSSMQYMNRLKKSQQDRSIK